ncbi:MAG: hypothetical protein K0Q93_830 [Nocardioidaceae bacterium]|jgi:hypothetical protein|nr:hypothetical protein [Nocardioidaceae bacterium]
MTPVELVLIVVLCGYAGFKQSQRHEVTGDGRTFELVWRRAQVMTAAADAPARGADTHDRTGGAHG